MIQEIQKKVEKETGVLMENLDKATRAVYGTATSAGLVGGIGIEAKAFSILAKYDELGGYMTKDGFKVKNRTFFDAKTKEPIEPKKVVLVIRVNGEWVEQEE